MFDSLAHYRIEEKIGEGGFAIVYRAFDQKFDQYVALKILDPIWMRDPDAVERFKREAKTMRSLNHPNILPIYDVDVADGKLYLAEYLVEGETLADRLKRTPLSWKEAIAVLKPIVSALDYAHRRKLIHRDMKPENILISEEGEVFVSDFGLVYAAEGSTAIKNASSGSVLGTFAYMAPEQWNGKPPQPTTDVYALTCILIEMLTGKAWVDATNVATAVTRHLVNRPPLPTNWASDIPAGLNAVLEKGLALDPTERIQSASNLLTQLEKLSAPKPTQKPIQHSIQPPEPIANHQTPKWLWGALAIAAVVIIMLAMALTNRPAADDDGLATVRAKLASTQTSMAIAAVPTQTHTPMPTADRAMQTTDTPTPKPTDAPRATDTPVPPPNTATSAPAKTDTPVPPTETATSTPTATRTPRPIATPTPFLTINTTAMNIRSGPGTNYDIVGKATQDETFAITARTADGDWLQLSGSDERWVYANLVDTNGAVPVAQSIPPSPTPNPVPPNMVFVPAGEFTMGSNNGESDEQPVHTVYLDSFYIDKYEVTNALFRQCVDAGVCTAPTSCDYGTPTFNDADKSNHPVVCVDWNDATTYCQWQGKSLPTEAQWEKAARGTDGRTYPWGEGLDCNKAQYEDCGGGTVPVGTKNGVSPYGAYDMAGNVWEWVNDWYDGNYYASSPASNPTGPSSGQTRGLRGGGWSSYWNYTRVANRNDYYPDGRGKFIGFRCAVSLGQ